MQLNPQVAQLPLGIRRIADMAREMPNAIRADVGESNIRPPQCFIDALHKATDELQFQYSDTLGVPPLREAIKQFEASKMAHYKNPEVLVTCGGEAALYTIISAFVAQGEEYIIPSTCFAPYTLISACLRATAVYVDFEDPDALANAVTEKTKLILVNTPNNPSGQILSDEALQRIAAVAKEKDLAIISDDVYDKIQFTGKELTHLASLAPERTFVLHSVSKIFSLSGVRVGWIIGEAEYIDGMKKIHRAMTSGTNTTAQYACVPLFQEHQYIEETKQEYQKRARALWELTQEMGWECQEPQGAMYLLPDVGEDGEVFAERLIKEKSISTVPGRFFGPGIQNRIRFSLGRLTLEDINEMRHRLQS